MIRSRNIIIISSIDWDFNWQGPQEIASRLARMGNRVLFIENTGVRRPQLRDAGRAWKRIRYWRNKIASNGFAKTELDIFLCSPIVLPPFGNRLQRYINRRLFLPSIEKLAKRVGMENPLILTFLPTDTAGELIKSLRSAQSKVVYYVASDFKELVSNPADLAESERQVVGMSDAVLTICPGLTNRYKLQNTKVYTIPYGVNLSAFQDNDKVNQPESMDSLISGLENEKRTVIGYVGAFHRHVNVNLLAECASRRKDWLWVFVGPVEENHTQLKNLPNVLFTGPQEHKNLAHFIKNFDVCTIPYVNNEYTKTVVPVKLNEYLAAGKPVVSTDIPAVQEFNKSHDVIKISENRPDTFLQAIDSCLAQEETATIIEKRKSVAALSDWEIHFSNICRILISDLPEDFNDSPLETAVTAARK